ncbi:MAG: CHASE2 domain-containing protein [Novosphingobium sp.]|uniref:CHASE2 domain-containing protein n=1 Tax=Novosphingobium sp. TaxID=1874826 RepID=UPI003B9AB14D
MLHRRLYGEWFVVALVTGALAWLATANQRLSMVDNRIYDQALRLAAPPVDDRILIVEIDEPSLQTLGRWPWPRSEHAKLLDTVASYRPKAIAYNVLFLDETLQDSELAGALTRAAPVYISALVEHDSTGQALAAQLPPAALKSAAAGLGTVDLLPDEDGVIRAMPKPAAPGGIPPLFSHLAAPERGDASEADLIAYAPRESFRRISFASLAAGEVPSALVRDKLLLIGATAPGLANQQPVPRFAGGLLAGVEIEANLLNTQLQNAGIRTIAPKKRAGLALIPLILLMIGFLRLSPSGSFWLAIGLASGTLIISLGLLVMAHIWLPPAGAIAGLVAAHILWGWRRLNVIGRFVISRIATLEKEPGLALATRSNRRGADIVSRDANRLSDLIEQLRQLRSFVSEAVEWLPAAICVVDQDGQIVLSNRAAKALLGEDIVGRPIAAVTAGLSLVPDKDHGLLRDRQGRFFLPETADFSGDYRILSYADVTDLQRIAEERDDILQFLSHDIRSPNAAIVTLLETEKLGGKSGSPKAAAETLGAIRLHARHALKLADDFVQLARARRRPMEPEPVDLCDVAREAADLVWPRARQKQVVVQDECVDGEIWILGDRSLILRAVVNLLENAVKFAPDATTVRFGVEAVDACAVLNVTGPGPEMPQGRAANPFALYAEGRAADDTGSLGLGLAFVQTITQRHDGKVTYRHHAGYGAQFTVELPLAQLEDELDEG